MFRVKIRPTEPIELEGILCTPSVTFDMSVPIRIHEIKPGTVCPVTDRNFEVWRRSIPKLQGKFLEGLLFTKSLRAVPKFFGVTP
jgi:hypothetical protein